MDSDDVATLINQFIAAEAAGGESAVFSEKIAAQLAGNITLLQLIQNLGPTLTSDDTMTRSHSLHCLAATLTHAPKLTRQDVNVLLQFLVNKLEDEKLTLHVLSGLASLVQQKTFLPHINDNLNILLSALTKDYEPRKHLAKVRYEGFHVLDALFSKHSDEISTNPEFLEQFVTTFVHVASGEKDPRNLLMSFKLNTCINQKITFDDRNTNKTHDNLLSELFDVCFCYFPISFTPPANDPYKITAENLKSELRNTIASQSQFAQDTFPSLFEKLTSTNPAVRNDVLQSLHQCVVEYSEPTIEQYWVTIWDALKFEILHNDVLIFRPEADYIIPPNAESIDDTDDNKTLIYTLKTLNAIAEKLDSLEMLKALSTTVINDLRANFKSLDEKTLKQSVLLLNSMGSTSVEVYNNVVEFLFSFEIWGKYIRSDYHEPKDETEIDVSLTVARQRELIDNLGFILTAYKVLNHPNVLVDYKDHLLIFMGQLLQTSSKLEKTLKCKITQQLIKLILLNDFLSREEVTLILGWLNENLTDIIENGNSNWQNDLLLSEILTGLVRIMSEGQDEALSVNVSSVIETILPTLLNNTLDQRVLDLINKLCVNYQFLEVLSIRFLNRLAYDNYDCGTFSSVVDCLIKSFNQTQTVKPFLTNTWYKNFIPRFLAITLKRTDNDIVVYELCGQLLGLVIRYIEKSKHQGILDEMVPVFVDNKEYEGVVVENIFGAASTKITLFKHFIAKIDKSTTFPEDVNPYIEKCITFASQEESEFIRLGYLQTLALLVNKFTLQNAEENGLILERLLKNIETNVDDFEVAVWIAKGLIIRLDAVGSKFLNDLITQLTESENMAVCKVISRSFNILMADLDVFMNKENTKAKIVSGVANLNVKLLYKQQIFENVLQKLISSFISAKPETKNEIYLGTLAIIINNVSTKILKPHLKEILPLVLNGLTIENSSILDASLQTFKVIIYESPQLISENLSSLVPKLVDLATTRIVVNKKLVNNEQIRLLSLECLLGVFTNLELGKVVKYQHSTRNQLSAGLDDKKRSVRKLTCDVRQALYELGR